MMAFTGSHWLSLALIGVGVICLLVAGLGLAGAFKRAARPAPPLDAHPAPAAQILPDQCQRCGAALPAEAKFCPKCGNQR